MRRHAYLSVMSYLQMHLCLIEKKTVCHEYWVTATCRDRKSERCTACTVLVMAQKVTDHTYYGSTTTVLGTNIKA